MGKQNDSVNQSTFNGTLTEIQRETRKKLTKNIKNSINRIMIIE